MPSCDEWPCENEASVRIVAVTDEGKELGDIARVCAIDAVRAEKRYRLYRRARMLPAPMPHDPEPGRNLTEPDPNTCKCGHARQIHRMPGLGESGGCNGCTGNVVCRKFDSIVNIS